MAGSLKDELQRALQESYDQGFRDGQVRAQKEILTALDAIVKAEAIVDLDQKIIDVLELSERPGNCLARAQIHTLRELTAQSASDLLYDITNFEQKSVDEVQEKLSRIGLKLRED